MGFLQGVYRSLVALEREIITASVPCWERQIYFFKFFLWFRFCWYRSTALHFLASHMSTPAASPNWGTGMVTGSLTVTEIALTARSILANASDPPQWLAGVYLDNQQHFKMLILLYASSQRWLFVLLIWRNQCLCQFSPTLNRCHTMRQISKRIERIEFSFTPSF